MSRFRQIVHGTASGYGVLVATALYGLASFPLALHYLSKERFGLWALMSTIGGYLVLVDLGMSGSVAWLLVDHKDQRAEELTAAWSRRAGWCLSSKERWCFCWERRWRDR